MTKEFYMRSAILLAEKGKGSVSPNPMVGAVLVKNGKIIGTGYHQKFGQNHAEIEAIENATEDVAGATLFCTLEPCCHTHKKTPPCTKRIIKENIAKVVIGAVDPNPKVNTKGLEELKKAGVEVETGVLEAECEELIEPYAYHIQHNIPFIAVKIAQTIDGKIADQTGHSKWISNQTARTMVHKMRAEYDAVLVGTNTALVDNPRLNVRHAEGQDPYRIIPDRDLNLPEHLNIFNYDDAKTIVIADIAHENSENAIKYTSRRKVQLIFTNVINNELNLKDALIRLLEEQHIGKILCEGGAHLVGYLLKKALVRKVYSFLSPRIMGEGVNMVEALALDRIENAIALDKVSYTAIDDQILISGYIKG